MTKAQFICHSKHFTGIINLAGDEVVAVPTKQMEIIRALMARRGFRGLMRIVLGERRLVDLRPLVERNLARRRIRLPWLYANPLVPAIYRLILLLKARTASALLEHTFSAHPQARSLAFNGFLMPNSLTLAVGKALERESLVLELGFFPGTTQVDVRGVNDDCTLPREPEFYSLVDSDVPHEMPEQLVRRPTKQKAQAKTALPQDYIFVPMQVPSDMQILHHSPWIQSMKHLYEVLLDLTERNSGLHLVIKEHPSFPLSIRGQVKSHPRITFANHNETRALIEGARAVITVNSTVGLESLLLGKKVITLGRTYYNIDGLVLHAEDAEQLSHEFSRLENWQPNATLRDQFIRYVYNVFLLKAERNRPTPEFLDALRRRADQTDSHHEFLRRFDNRSGDPKSGQTP
jgi:capsular polysaccharide export protein